MTKKWIVVITETIISKEIFDRFSAGLSVDWKVWEILWRSTEKSGSRN